MQRVGERSILDFGAVGDGVTDNRYAFQSAMSYFRQVGGGILTVAGAKKSFAIAQTVQIPDNVVIRFGSWVKVIGTTQYDCAFMGVPGATNVVLENVMVDCNEKPAQSGVIIRRDNTEFRINGGYIKNAKHESKPLGKLDPNRARKDDIRGGGRGINIEAGVSHGRCRNEKKGIRKPQRDHQWSGL